MHAIELAFRARTDDPSKLMAPSRNIAANIAKLPDLLSNPKRCQPNLFDHLVGLH
jgi:hypothetical protein